MAAGATARLDDAPFGRLAMRDWRAGLMTTLQYRVYLDKPAVPIAYRTLELHYYVGQNGRQIIGWMFPKRDHLAIGLGTLGKMDGETLRGELERFAAGVTDSVEVVQAQQALASANDQYISSLYNHNLSKLQLARALGVARTNYNQYLTVQ